MAPHWWPSFQVVNWVCGLDPTLTVEKVLDALEDRCAVGRVRAQGRFYVYSTNLSIKLNAQEVELYSSNSSRVRDFFEQIPVGEWRDLTFFPLPAIRSGESWEASVAREFASPPGPRIALRSKRLWRLVYADPQFSRDDVIREWQEPQSATDPTEPAPSAVPDIDGLKEHDAGRHMGRQPARRGAYLGALEQFILRFKSDVFARMSDDAIARQFELHCENLARTGKPAPPLPADRRNIARRVATIRERLAATNINRAARATPKTR